MLDRTGLLKKNIFFSLLFKGISICATLGLVPLTINYLDENQYGVWLVLSSIISWLGFFDIGLGNGLKTRLTAAIVENDSIKARRYVSTTYGMLLVVSIILTILFVGINFFIDWSRILNTTVESSHTLRIVVYIVFCSFVGQFLLNVIVTIAAANQNTILGAFVNCVINVASIFVIFLMVKAHGKGSIIQLSIPVSLIPIVVLFFTNFFLFKTRYRDISPHLSFFDFNLLKDVMGLGWKFFVIQLGLILVYNIHNVLIAQMFGPEFVTKYNIAYRYFGIVTLISGIVMAPLWAAFGEAHKLNDRHWIKSTILKMQKVALVLAFGTIFMFLMSSIVYNFWIGNDPNIPLLLSALLGVYVVLNSLRTIYVFYLNGVGIVTLQVILVAVSGILNVPLGIILGSYLGLSGIILSTLILNICCFAFEYIQFSKIFNGTASGIWNN